MLAGLGVEEREVVGEAERRRLDARARARRPWPRPAGRAARRPRRGGSGSGRRAAAATARRARRRASDVEVPHRHGAADELVAARALHAVDAQVGAADADGVLGRPGAGRVVLRGHQPVAGVERRGHRRAEVDVAEAEHEVAGVEHDAVHVVDRVEAVDPADELEVRRAPRGVVADDLHVAADGLEGGRVLPRQREVDGAGVDRQLAGRRQLVVALLRPARPPRRPSTDGRVELHQQRPHPGGDVDDRRRCRWSASQRSRAWTRARRARSSAISPYSTSTKASPDRRIGERGPVAGGGLGGTSTPDGGVAAAR